MVINYRCRSVLHFHRALFNRGGRRCELLCQSLEIYSVLLLQRSSLLRKGV